MTTVTESLLSVRQDSEECGSEPSTQNSSPLFVVGMWRSGTSLLYALLNQHPQIALMYEGDLFLLRPMFWLPRAKSRYLARWEFWNRAVTRHKLDEERIQPHNWSPRSCVEKAYQEMAAQKGALIWGEKSPSYYDLLTRLARNFPDARFIVIWRDPADICRSVVSAANNPWFNRAGEINRTLIGYKVLKTQCDRLVSSGARVHQVQYESLVREPVRTMTDICRFLGLAFDPKVASLQNADRSAIYQGEHHSLVKGEHIISSRKRAEVLPPSVKKKIERYMTLWRAQSGGTWPEVATLANGNGTKPTWLERIYDQCAYSCFRSLDFVITVIYSYMPLPLLRAYRAYKQQR